MNVRPDWTLIAAASVIIGAIGIGAILLLTSSDDSAPQPARPGGVVEAPNRVDTPSGQRDLPSDEFLGDDGITDELLDELIISGDLDAAWEEGPAVTRSIDEEVAGLSGPEEAAARFALALYSWTFEQPEADRIDGIAAYVSGQVAAQLAAPADLWPQLDATRQRSQEVAVARLSYVDMDRQQGGAIPVRVQVSTERRSDVRVTEQRFTVGLWLRGSGDRWVIERLEIL